MAALPAFTEDENRRAKVLLATQVASMMGRKLEEGDWTKVYCAAKKIPQANWSNLHIDVNYAGFGIEVKLLRIAQRPLRSVCGTTLMHPSATRSIRIDDTMRPADSVMRDVFAQYAELLLRRAASVREKAPGREPDMRTGWLIWEETLAEFLYFEERMIAPDSNRYYAEWNETRARGVRKPSKSLWIFDRASQKKRYSVTTSAGIKIQPYFDVPPPSDPNLYHFRVQSEPVDGDTVLLSMASSTARALEQRLGSLDRDVVSAAAVEVLAREAIPAAETNPDADFAVSVPISLEAHELLTRSWEAVSDEHLGQLLLKALTELAAK